MIKNNLRTVCLAAILLTTSLAAEEFKIDSDTYSLVGIEAGYSRIDSELNDFTNTSQMNVGSDLSSIGFKVGAETANYRVFLNSTYLNDYKSSYDYIATYGVVFQYKFNISKETNMFVGVNSGIANMKFKLKGENLTRTLSNSYIGGGFGFDVSMSKSLDFEVGARYLNMQASNVKNNKEYILNDMMSYYTSLIFKFQMN